MQRAIARLRLALTGTHEDEDEDSTLKVLIGCHTNPDKHWVDIDAAVRDVAEEGRCVEKFAVDINQAGAPDLFEIDNWYIQEHEARYDIIFLPDCGGAWYDTQAKGGFKPDDLLPLIQPSLYMLKPGGYLFVSKFIR